MNSCHFTWKFSSFSSELNLNPINIQYRSEEKSLSNCCVMQFASITHFRSWLAMIQTPKKVVQHRRIIC
ncbi:hypothetical protein DERF_005920 [Dermatophagoides farinae]|uniref:Uncharacterized protein n=1 Tax=Dermatophagoides farinae TaxID=6954 RepID=A0A922L748_DERFA|nr:hypothetical protein DERF_005920 [Dermatophagoides farinae]